MKVNRKVLKGLEHVHRFLLSSRSVNISIGTPYNLIYGYQNIILTPLILLYELKNTKPMPSLTLGPYVFHDVWTNRLHALQPSLMPFHPLIGNEIMPKHGKDQRLITICERRYGKWAWKFFEIDGRRKGKKNWIKEEINTKELYIIIST